MTHEQLRVSWVWYYFFSEIGGIISSRRASIRHCSVGFLIKRFGGYWSSASHAVTVSNQTINSTTFSITFLYCAAAMCRH